MFFLHKTSGEASPKHYLKKKKTKEKIPKRFRERYQNLTEEEINKKQ